MKMLPSTVSETCAGSKARFVPNCGYDTLYPIKWRDVWKCAGCRKNFSITVGTIFQRTKIPLRNWLLAIAYVIDYPGNVSGTALAKELGISQKRAWLMIERLRQATLTRSFKRPEAGKHARPKLRKRSERDQAGNEGGRSYLASPTTFRAPRITPKSMNAICSHLRYRLQHSRIQYVLFCRRSFSSAIQPN
jgi:transposase-like protein